MNELIITKAVPSDMEEIALMYKKRVLFNNAHGIPQWRLEEVTWDAFHELYTVDDCYVGKVNGEIVCSAFIVDVDKLYWPNEEKGVSLYLHKFCVHPDHGGKGYSDGMLTFFKKLGKERGYKEVRLDVREHKAKLRAMYERNGFTYVGRGDFVKEFSTALYHYVY